MATSGAQPQELPRQPQELPRQPQELPRQPQELPRQLRKVVIKSTCRKLLRQACITSGFHITAIYCGFIGGVCCGAIWKPGWTVEQEILASTIFAF